MTTATSGKATEFTARINRIEISATLAITMEAEQLRAAGHDLADFGAGEPHFATPQHIKDAAIAAIQNNFTFSVDLALMFGNSLFGSSKIAELSGAMYANLSR